MTTNEQIAQLQAALLSMQQIVNNIHQPPPARHKQTEKERYRDEVIRLWSRKYHLVSNHQKP